VKSEVEQLEEILRLSFIDFPYGISIVDPQGRQIAGNRMFSSLLGRQPASGSLDVGAMTRDSDLQWTATYLLQLVNGDLDSYATDKVFVLPDGTERLLHLQAQAIRRDGECIAVVGVLQPVRLRAPLADHRTRKLLENIVNTISLIDRDGMLIETSGRYRRILGYPAEFWETRSIFDLLHPDDAERVHGMRDAVLAEPGYVLTGEFEVRAADGSYQPLHVDAVNLLADPDVGGIVVTSRNISVERSILRELVTRTEAAENEAYEQSRLIATVSHELRNPLHALSGLSELLATTDLPAEQSTLAVALHRQITGLTGVLDDLLESSRLDAGGVTFSANSVLIRPLVEDVVALATAAVGDRDIEIGFSIDPLVPEAVEVDRSRLRQILVNLLGNATKFTQDGRVHLGVDHAASGSVRFVVADTGRGIPPGDLERIFEPFAAGGNAGTSTGAGLGLTIVRQLVGAMGGTIWATSTLGQGSRFIVELPLCATSSPVAEEAGCEPSTARATVLVVEDNEVNQLLARRQLERLGLDCIVVGTGELALEVLQRADAPEFVLMDFQLPGIDGLETTRRLRAMEAGGRQRRVVIGVTASAMMADRATCREAGMDDFLAKPVGLAELGDKLQLWITRSRAEQAESMITGLDRAVLEELATELGFDIVVQLVETYLGELERRRHNIDSACAAGEFDLARRGAHTLKSSSLLLGARELGAACSSLERLNDVSQLGEAVKGIASLADDVRRELHAWLLAERSLT